MSKEKKTECECPLAGFCSRHGIKKNKHWHKLCQSHEGYFQMWEECKGPGQHFTDCSNTEPPKPKTETKSKPYVCKFCDNKGCNGACRNKNKMPSTLEMAKNLAKATTQHVKSGFNEVSQEVQKERMDTCLDCEYYVPQQDRCSQCGCYLSRKTKWKTSTCPIGKW